MVRLFLLKLIANDGEMPDSPVETLNLKNKQLFVDHVINTRQLNTVPKLLRAPAHRLSVES